MKGANIFRLALVLLACVGPAKIAVAHDPGLSTATFVLGAEKTEATLEYSAADAVTLVHASGASGKPIQKDEPAQIAARLRELAPQAFDIKFGDRPGTVTSVSAAFDDVSNVTIRLGFAHRPFSKLSVRSKWLAALPPGHREFLLLERPDGETIAELLLSATADSLTVEVGDAAPSGRSAPKNSFSDFLVMGVKHIWTGYDHLLFLFGLLIVTRDFKASIKIITCFTLAHSLTLAAATLNLVQISSRIVEPLIAASIVFVGVENLVRTGEFKWRWALAFAFGLIHGFGFASVLRELGVGENGGSIVVPLISFNLGVEFGQIAIAAIVLPVIWKLRTRPVFVRRWVPACSTLVVALGAFWFVQRVWY